MNLSILLGVIGPWQIALVVALVLLMFGGKKLPELMKGIGQGIREFKDAKDGSTTTKDELPEKKN
jgi:sec-independent protein translocase protein TatA